VAFGDNGENVGSNGLVIEASVTGTASGFTDNEIEVWYYSQPAFISLSVNGAPTNQRKTVLVETDFKWNVNNYELIKTHGNFSCRFTSRDGKRQSYSLARMETLPLGSQNSNALPTHIRCNSPLWAVSEEVTLDLTLNGADYLGGFTFTFYDGIDLYRVVPMAGPSDGHTRVKLYGAGFNNA
jgi:hypothetical protein